MHRKYVWNLYLIITTIIISIVVQVYLNFKNYQISKQQFVSQIQNSLDNATDNYFVELAKNEHPFFTNNRNSKVLISNNNRATWASATSNKDTISITIKSFGSDSLSSSFTRIKKLPKKFNAKFGNNNNNNNSTDSFFHGINYSKNNLDSIIKQQKIIFTDIYSDSTEMELITGLQSIYFSIKNDSLDFRKLHSLFTEELKRKNIRITYQLNHYKNNIIISSNGIYPDSNIIKTIAKSTYLQKGERIELLFTNQTKTHLKKGLVGILLSLLLSIAIISSLFYLMHIIKKQKQIAEIKNDFISNITHEFKTPITTIGLAVDSIKHFNTTNNHIKSKEYLTITKEQLDKLNIMVEKILETSILDSKELLLKKEPTDISKLLKKTISKHQMLTNKAFKCDYSLDTILNVDTFHFENALSNLIDNAVKYGGDNINIQLLNLKNRVAILIMDDGSISKQHRDKIFDKFYRIPKGNTHDIKGFGIGLYYTKKIIEKHLGKIELLNENFTIFKITLPNE